MFRCFYWQPSWTSSSYFRCWEWGWMCGLFIAWKLLYVGGCFLSFFRSFVLSFFFFLCHFFFSHALTLPISGISLLFFLAAWKWSLFLFIYISCSMRKHIWKPSRGIKKKMKLSLFLHKKSLFLMEIQRLSPSI